MTARWEGDGRREVMQGFAEEAASAGEHFLYVRIPGDWSPIERGRQFEDALDAALRDAGIGGITGGSSQLGEGNSVEYCGIDVVVTDRDRAIEMMRRALRDRSCPRGAVLEEYVPDYRELPMWLEPR